MINIGIIGAGMWGNVHMDTLRKSGRATLRWVCDVHPAASAAAQAKFAIPNATQEYAAVLDDPAVDAVVVATPPYTHVDIGIAALRAGKHLLIEKPMAINRAQVAQFLAEVAQHPDRVVLEGSCRHARLNPKFAFVKSLVESGKLGEIYHITHRHLGQGTFIEYNPNASWSMDKTLAGGGPFIDWGEYDLSFHLGVLGDKPEIRAVKAFTRAGLRDLGDKVSVADVEMHGAAFLEFDGGLTYLYERGGGVHGETRNETWLFGTKGGLHFYYTAWEPATVEYFYGDATPRHETFTVDMSAHAAHDNIPFIAHFIDCLEGAATPLMPPALAAKHLDIVFRILGIA